MDPRPEFDAEALVRRAKRGDERAWRELIAGFNGMLRRVAKGYGLAPQDVDDVVQTAWIRAFCHIGSLSRPGAIGAWLVVTTRREALRHLQRGVREILTEELPEPACADEYPTEVLALERERDLAVRAAVRRLTGRQRQVLRMMLARPGVTYDELSSELEMPIGSIGPTRARCLEKLRKLLADGGYVFGA